MSDRSHPPSNGVYTWLPHSTALGASSTVTLRIVETCLTTPSVRHSGWCRVEASVCEFGEAIAAAPISTKFASLNWHHNHDWEVNEENLNAGGLCDYTDNNSGHAAIDLGLVGDGGWAIASLEEAIISLPIRWRDLTRDACLTLNVLCDMDMDIDMDTDTHEARQSANQNHLSNVKSDIYRNACDDRQAKGMPRIWGTTLPLFDEVGQLRAGLYKLKLYPNLMADGGMSYQSCRNDEIEGGGVASTENQISMETTVSEGGATPGIHGFGRHNKNNSSLSKVHRTWIDERKINNDEEQLEDSEEDPKWKASLILHELNRMETMVTSSTTMKNPVGGASAVGGAFSQSSSYTSSVPWLDTLTRQRCLDILSDEEGRNGCKKDDSQLMGAKGHCPQLRKIPAPTSSHHHTPYLIIELPKSPIPILYEEPIYPVETSTHLRATTGSITANELIHFHSKFQPQEESKSGYGSWTVRMNPLATVTPGTTLTEVIDVTNNNITSTIPFPQAFLYPLVQILDHEPPLTDENESPQDNPAQDKYRILAHDLIRGLVDPGLKPDRIQRGRLERIIGSPSYHLSTEEKDLLWRFRFSLVDNRRALTKFLLAVDWTVESEVVQAAELLEQWRKRSPIEVTDALKLLGRNVAFQTSLVRSYAIETLSSAPDEELRLYLLQLVQALKYEEDISGGTSDGREMSRSFVPLDTMRGASVRVSLAAFLIERASRNIELANFFYWYLRVEMSNPIYEARYREVFISFHEKIASVFVKNGSIVPQTQLSNEADPLVSLWDMFAYQERFISGIMDCHRDSFCVRGKKDVKEAHLKESLEKYKIIPHAVPLPSAPHIFVKGVRPDSVKMFKSALYPAVVDFIVDRIDKDNKCREANAESMISNSMSDSSYFKVMIKTGDDLRQDQLVIMMIQLMDRLLKRGTLDLCLKPYSILAMPNNAGLVEFVEPSIPVSQILSSNNNSIMAYFQKVAPQEGARYSVKSEVLQTYVRSCAGYCVITYLLGVGDRHLDNIMIQPSGHFFHIDFGFIFGRDPKPLPPAFRLTKEMVDGMGGTDSKEYRQFCSLACQAFNVIRKSAGLVLNLLHLMSDAGIEDLSNNPNSDAIGIISKVEERFKLELTDEQAESFYLSLIGESLSALAPRVMEMFHQLSVARR